MSDQRIEDEEESNFHLPNELLFQILGRLPAKSLVRFMCVSKFWKSLLTNPTFFLSHLHHSSSNHPNLLFRNYSSQSNKEVYTLHSDNAEFQHLETLEFPFKATPPSSDDAEFRRFRKFFTIIGCVNGLLCLWDKTSSKFMLWNPAIRKHFVLPHSGLKPNPEFDGKIWNPVVARDFCFGFGFDPLSNDFKLVWFVYYRNGDTAVAAVFSLNRRSWVRTLDYSPALELFSRSCNVGRFVYRMTQGLEIVSFDLSAEVFARKPCPEEVVHHRAFNAELMAFRGALALLEEQGLGRYHVWVMRDDGVDADPWTKMFSVNLDHDVSVQRIVGFPMPGKMVVVGEGQVLVSPGVEDVQVVQYVPSRRQEERSWHMELFKESLFLLDVGSNLPIIGDGN